MREILFKAKRIDSGEWVDGFFYICTDNYTPNNRHYIKTVKVLENKEVIITGIFEIDPTTLCQYTGLTDKNCVKIFEGDIVRFQIDNYDCPFPNKRIEKIIGKVFYSEWRASFSVTMGKSLSDIVNNNLYEYIRGGNRVEVIGSIHDTPELTNQAATPHAEPIEAGTRRGEQI